MLDIAYLDSRANQVSWIHGDALSLKESNIDLVIMTSHVFQCFLENDYLVKTLETINKSLKVGGYLSFDSRNSLIKIEDFNWPSENNPNSFINNEEEILFWVELLESKQNYVKYKLHYFNQKTKEELVSTNELIFRSQEEITRYLSQAGFEVEKVYGNWDKTPVTNTSPEFIFIARKK